ncbi:hypothetical protein PL75_03605 [Neisseria arctica]|uniref:Multidrug ABC transporter ATP-binding protein n=1 Tax=Neisseria arctica TaxID=1470200 RepID=A0A0J0YT89_9NEIS|nr:ribosome-associated ATPase/putative transporter RbbA [Neisseria arctica]KLT73312.1 hypothetical protein PL75_03605 [Neisseria arctica]UOO87424.1 ribosome-associated ATPase/putative transporter RbbA [Neisseria arctica]
MNTEQTSAVTLHAVSHHYGKTLALDNISLELPRGVTVGLIGPDGVGKSTLLSLIAGVKVLQNGSITVLGGDIEDKAARQDLACRIAFMPQGLGRNLYPTLSVYENIDFHARLFGLEIRERKQRIQRLLDATGLAPFPDRAAGKLSGGMKQKLSLCCALVHNPDLLILDEPTTGVDPLSRRQFWALVETLKQEIGGMTVIVATAYIEEAEHFEHLWAMDDGKLLVNSPTREVMRHYGAKSLEEAYIAMLPDEKRQGVGSLEMTPFVAAEGQPPAMEAHGLTKCFGNFTAVDNVSFTIQKGEIFGFLGSNGCGKSTTMKMLTGLIEASEGTAELLGKPVDAGAMDVRMRVGYMSQAFSLYEELSVRRNLELHARLYQMGEAEGRRAVREALQQFDLADVADTPPAALSLGMRQRLQLAAACLHRPEVLILDEPTSGVDPAARDMFWRHLLKLSREDRITIFVSTHFMNEAARCDRISFMHRGRVLAVGTPQELLKQQNVSDLEEAFIGYLLADEEAENQAVTMPSENLPSETAQIASDYLQAVPEKTFGSNQNKIIFSDGLPAQESRPSEKAAASGNSWLGGVWTFAAREAKELLRDKIRLFFAVLGPVILMAALSWSISFDVQNLRFAVFDQDQTTQSRELVEYFSGSPYFVELPQLQTRNDIDRVLKSAEAQLVIDIPSGFGVEMMRANRPEVGFYIDGSAPFNAENIKAYVGGILSLYTRDSLLATGLPVSLQPAADMEARFLYNQDFKSMYAVAPGIMMMVLMLIPAMMTAIGVVREREIGSIANLYASPATVSQYLVGKQLPYIVVGMVNYCVLFFMMIFWFQVPLKGSFAALTLGTVLMICVSTALGLLVSSFVRSQVAAIFVTAIITLVPTVNYSGFLYPISTMTGSAYWIGTLFPASWYLRISVGTFTKGLDFTGLYGEFAVLAVSAAVFLTAACLLLKKQEV